MTLLHTLWYVLNIVQTAHDANLSCCCISQAADSNLHTKKEGTETMCEHVMNLWQMLSRY